MDRWLIIGRPPLAASVQKDVRPVSDKTFLIIVFAVIGIFLLIARTSAWAERAAKKAAQNPYTPPTIPPAELATLVATLAQDILGIGAHQLDEPMEKLRITRGDFLTFLDDLEQDHGLRVPASARAMSTSISGVVAALYHA